MQLNNDQMTDVAEAWRKYCLETAGVEAEYAAAKAVVEAARANQDEQKTQADFIEHAHTVSRAAGQVQSILAMTDFSDVAKWRNFRDGWAIGLKAMKDTA